MGSEQDALLYLKRNVAEIKTLGTEWGLTEEEIDGCIERALKVDLDEKTIDDSAHSGRKLWSSLRGLFKVWCVVSAIILLLTFGLFVLMAVHEPTDNYINKITGPYGYAAFRYVRLAALPLHRWFPDFQFNQYYDSECIVDNPMYAAADIDCKMCHSIRKISEYPGNHSKFVRDDRPGVFRNYSKHNVTYNDIVAMYKQNPDSFNFHTYNFQTNNATTRTLQQMFGDEGVFEKIKKTNGFHAEWESRRPATSASLRVLYPRPTFIRKQSEVTMDKKLLIDGPHSPHTTLRPGHYEGSWLVQSYGKRTVFLRVPENCNRECHSLRVVLQQGDALFFDFGLWSVDLLPTGDDASIMFQGGFSML